MRLAPLFLVIALLAAGLHLWQLYRAIVLGRQLEEITIESLTGGLSALGDQMSATADERERIAQRLEQQQQNRESEYDATLQSRSLASAVATISIFVAPVFLVFGFASISSAASDSNNAGAEAFISYNHRNLDQAEEIKKELIDRRCAVTLINQLLDVSGDQELAKVLSQKILGTQVMIVLLTPESLKSDWVGFERVLGDTRLRKIVYVYHGISIFSGIWRTHFLHHKSAGFKIVKALQAQRRYVNRERADALDLVAAHLRNAHEQAGTLMSLKQCAYSFGSLDQMTCNAVFNLCENRMLTSESTRLWKVGMAACMYLQAAFAALPLYFLLVGATVLMAIFG